MSNWRLGITIWLLTAALGGCSPKRISSDGVVIGVPDARTESTAARATNRSANIDSPKVSLPDPQPIPRSGSPVPDFSPTAATALGFRAVILAEAQLGKPYQWGAAGPNKFDCSGLVQYVYANLGVPLPRVSRQQAAAGVHVDREDLEPGDLVFFTLTGSRIDHVGIYVGGSKFIHAPRQHSPVREDSLHNSWWRRKFKGGRRVG